MGSLLSPSQECHPFNPSSLSHDLVVRTILYAQLRGHREVLLPKAIIDIFKTVKAYENYVRSLRSKLFSKLLKKSHQESVAKYETDKLFRSLGLPKIDTS